MNDITLLLQATSRKEDNAREELFKHVYAELRRIAAARMAGESAGQTMQPTALVHEAWLELVGDGDRSGENRAHFFGAAAEAMRHILIIVARRKATQKRGGTLNARVSIFLRRLCLDSKKPAGAILPDFFLEIARPQIAARNHSPVSLVFPPLSP